ncbi:hypothetical protein [Salmonella enterica]|uniref:hypothetical protein n=1 Tax=Salmonella enterica TaxID=28901 RepID=UPI001E4C9701|nr:hypothetical protein [Salmonella enterica]MCD3189195.1 hypothetical protein [Salmonella enterica subsp. enterica serovar Enteritidis]
MPPLKKIVLRLFVGAMVATVTTPALALVCLEDHSAKECAISCAEAMLFIYPICFLGGSVLQVHRR